MPKSLFVQARQLAKGGSAEGDALVSGTEEDIEGEVGVRGGVFDQGSGVGGLDGGEE